MRMYKTDKYKAIRSRRHANRMYLKIDIKWTNHHKKSVRNIVGVITGTEPSDECQNI